MSNKTAISLPRIALGVSVGVFLALFVFKIVVSYPAADVAASKWLSTLAMAVVFAAMGSTMLVALLALWVTFAWIWFRTAVAFGRVPRWNLGWIFDPSELSEEGKAARLWLLRVYGVIAFIGVALYALEAAGVS